MSLNDIDSDSDEEVTLPDDFDLSKVFETATKLKSAQLANLRKEYESSPEFIRATYAYADRNSKVFVIFVIYQANCMRHTHI